jgi:hypothetical protein
MKKIKFLIQCKQMNEKIGLEEVYVTEYDDYCYYYSPKYKGNEKLFDCYQMIDKLTGLVVVFANNKDLLINRYEMAQDRYFRIIKGKIYNKKINEYQAKIKEVKNND